MDTQNIYLTAEENKALLLMANGYNSLHIKQKCDIPLSGMGQFTSTIRRKTGIRDHKNPMECRTYLERYAATMENPSLTEQQLNALRRILEGETLMGIGYQLGEIGEDGAAKLIDEACNAVGIFTRDERTRRIQIRIYLSTLPRNIKPPSPVDLKILRLMAEGMTPQQIAREWGERERYIVIKARDVCLRLGFNARGRDVQRQLIRGWLTRFDGMVMSDPMF
jgi:DNA-binding CsgD family transcriptional regulator